MNETKVCEIKSQIDDGKALSNDLLHFAEFTTATACYSGPSSIRPSSKCPSPRSPSLKCQSLRCQSSRCTRFDMPEFEIPEFEMT